MHNIFVFVYTKLNMSVVKYIGPYKHIKDTHYPLLQLSFAEEKQQWEPKLN